jgi:hypothetical protein
MAAASSDNSTSVDLTGQGLAYEAVAAALVAFKDNHKKLPSKLLLNKNAIGVDGIQTLANDWLQAQKEENTCDIETLSVRSCSVGRLVDPNTGAYVFSKLATAALGRHGNRLVNINLAWNDLTPAAIGELVKGLLSIEAPNFDAESFNPASLELKRGCALSTLELEVSRSESSF